MFNQIVALFETNFTSPNDAGFNCQHVLPLIGNVGVGCSFQQTLQNFSIQN